MTQDFLTGLAIGIPLGAIGYILFAIISCLRK